ncbi:DUF4864 domain-containing protein [Tianweitania sediminis]
MMRRSAIPFAFFSLFMMPVGSAGAGEAEVAAAQAVIEQQMQAFRSDQDGVAYGFASPTLRRIYPTPEAFMAMVRNAYPMVHRPRNFAFGAAEDGGSEIKQTVMILGPDGKDYEALYTLQQQPDGSWLISSVNLRAANSLST